MFYTGCNKILHITLHYTPSFCKAIHTHKLQYVHNKNSAETKTNSSDQ